MGDYTGPERPTSHSLIDGCSFLLLYWLTRNHRYVPVLGASVCRSPDKYMSEEPSSFCLPLTSLCDLPLLFFYFQVNTGVLYLLDFVEDNNDADDPPCPCFNLTPKLNQSVSWLLPPTTVWCDGTIIIVYYQNVSWLLAPTIVWCHLTVLIFAWLEDA